MVGALDGITVLELASMGPGPFACMMLADHGARVVRVRRPGSDNLGSFGKRDILNRNRELLELDLKEPSAIDKVRVLAREADALIEGYRPGVLERLGLSPELLLEDNPRLVIGRMTGWGQEGPMADRAGHDINYIAMSGALHTYGRSGQKPTPPLNAVGDYGGGGMMMAFGVLAGILSARATGRGQVIDCAMLDGAAAISAATYMMLADGMWRDERGVNILDTGAPYYDTYETRDGLFVSVGPLEDEFYAELLDGLGLANDPVCQNRDDPRNWPAIREKFTQAFQADTREHWCCVFDGKDACFAPVLSLTEAPAHPHNIARGTFIEIDGLVQPAPAPRFSRTPAPHVRMPAR